MQRTLVALEFVVSTRSQKSSLQATLTTESRSSPFKIGFALLAVLASFALATIVAMRSNEEQARVDRVNRTEWTIASIDDRLNSYSEVLYGFLHFFEHGNDEHGSFSAMVERLDVASGLPGVQVIGAAHLVDSSQAEAYTKRSTQGRRTLSSNIPSSRSTRTRRRRRSSRSITSNRRSVTNSHSVSTS